MFKTRQALQIVMTTLVILVISFTLLSGCEGEDDPVSGTTYSGPATVFHSESWFLEFDTDTGSYLKAPLPWKEQIKGQDCRLLVKYSRENSTNEEGQFKCPPLSSGKWSDSWQSSMTERDSEGEVTSYDIANCIIEPTSSPLKCSDSGQTQSADTDENNSGWFLCENETSSNRSLYDVVVSSSLVDEVMAHAQLDGVQLYTEVMRFGENPDDIITNIKLLCSESTPSPAANTVSGLAIGDTCAHQPHMFEALRTGHLQHSITEYGLFWLEASAPQCRQGLCLSMAQHTPELSIDEAICGVGDDHNTIADCVKSGSLSETSACTCRCEDERGNRAEANSSLCTCPDNMECVSLSQEYSDYPPELQGGYCVSK